MKHAATGSWPVTLLEAGFAVRAVRPIEALPADQEARVASIWAEERARHPHLFNGRVFSADRIAPDRIDGHWTEYRRVLAQLRAPDLFAARPIRPLAVNGLLRCAGGLVLGRRAPGAVYLPGCWQSPPAGSVEQRATGPADEAIDLAAQVLAECQEELGTAPDTVRMLQPVAAIAHPVSHVIDIGILLRTDLGFAQIEAGWAAHGNREYDRLALMAPGHAPEPGANSTGPDGADLLPTTRTLIDCWAKAEIIC